MQSSLASYNSFLVMSNMFARYGARAKPFIWFKINPRFFFRIVALLTVILFADCNNNLLI